MSSSVTYVESLSFLSANDHFPFQFLNSWRSVCGSPVPENGTGMYLETSTIIASGTPVAGGILGSGPSNPDGYFVRCFLLQAFAVGSKKIEILDQTYHVSLRFAGRRTPPQLLNQDGLGL